MSQSIQSIPQVDFHSEVSQTVQIFIAQVADVARRASIDALGVAFSDAGAHLGAAHPGAQVRGPAHAGVGRPPGSRAPKRTPTDLDELSQTFASFVRTNPGLRIEQINQQLGTTTRHLMLPIRKLIGQGAIRTEGNKRSTKYFAEENAGKAEAKAEKAAGKKAAGEAAGKKAAGKKSTKRAR